MLEEGRLYKVDTRLRPSGEQGLLVTSWSAFERYHRDEAAGWERVALLRARVVFSDEDAALRATRQAELAAIAFDRPFDPKNVHRRPAPRPRARRDRARARAGGLAPPALRSRRHHGRRVSGRARPAASTPPIPASASPRPPRRSRAWSRSAGRSRCATTTRRCAARRCGCACCSTVPRTSCRRAISRCSPAASGRPPTRSAPIWTRGWRASGRCSRSAFGDLTGLPAGSRYSSASASAGDAVEAQLLPQVLAGDAQDLGGLHLLAVGLGQRAQQVLVLELLHRGGQRAQVSARRAGRRRRAFR